MRPSSHLCIFLFGTRAQDYTSSDDCPACWVTKACTFICAYSPSNLLLPTSAGGQKVLPFTAASWENKGSCDTALKGSGTCKEKWKLRSTHSPPTACSVPVLPAPLVPQAGHWTWSLQGLLEVKCRLPPTMQVHTLLCCFFSGAALLREEGQADI